MDAPAAPEAAPPPGTLDDGHHPDNAAQAVLDEGENKFQKAITAWRGVNFSGLISQLDATASEIVANQRDALVERKELAQKTKDFRKLDDDSKLHEYKSLLKAYQTFIDLITSHGKTSQSAFLQLYTPISDAPDPFPLLEASVEALVTSEDTLPRLASENEELKRRVSRLTTQLEETEKKLQEESKGRREAESVSGEQLREVESKWTKVLEEKQSNWEAKETALEEKVENQDRLLKDLKASYEVAERLNQSSEAASEGLLSKAAAAELDMLTSEFEKTSTRLAEVEARNEQLRVELARATSQSTSGQDAEAEAELLTLRSENSSLLRKIETSRFEKDADKREWEAKLRQADRLKAQLTAETDNLRTKVQNWSDYDELKRELDVLRSIELSVEDDDDIERPANGSVDAGKKDSLEQLLLARNKKLTNDMALIRVAHQDTQRQLEELQEELSRTNAELETSQKLATTLENDLERVQDEAASALPSSGMSVAGTYTSRYFGSMRRGRASPTSSIISGYDSGSRSASTTLEALRSGEPVGGGSGILPMVQAQRDRFKQKNQKLEEELQKTHATVSSLRQEMASLQKDNLNLYEKSRYVSAYSRGSNTGATSTSAFGAAPSHTGVHTDSETSGGTDRRWKSQYESHISPFAAFRGREAARAYQRMSPPERTIFSLTRIVLATRLSRNLFAVYCMALHLLVFVMLYWTSAAQVNAHTVTQAVGGAAKMGTEWKVSDEFG
ncbi:hypothetical protein DV736_g3761, partial [Chaetothyriales sp. CBS 134916]